MLGYAGVGVEVGWWEVLRCLPRLAHRLYVFKVE